MRGPCITAGLAVVGVLACGAPGVSVRYYADLNRTIAAGNQDAALAMLEKSRSLYGEKSTLLYLMDKAMILTLAGRYEQSNANIQAAEELIEALYTKSVTREAASFLTSDASLPYEGEDFEKVFLNVLGALNHAMLSEPDEAAVEARRADQKLAEMARTRGGKTAYGEDAFVRYLMGLMYEDAGETNDAWISYARAIQTYQAQSAFGVPVPASLVRRAVIVGTALGFHEEVSALQETFKIPDPVRPRKGSRTQAGRRKTPRSRVPEMGRIIVVEFAGNVPTKMERRIEVTLAQGIPIVQTMDVASHEEQQVSSALSVAKSLPGTTNIVIAYPVIVGGGAVVSPARVLVSGQDTTVEAVAEVAHNLQAIAPVCLEERMGRIWGRTVARAVIKFLLAYAAEKAGEAAGGKKYGWLTGLLAGSVTSAALSASEHADTRSWGTLPAEVHLAVLEVPPGDYEVEVQGLPWSRTMVRVESNRSVWRLVRTR